MRRRTLPSDTRWATSVRSFSWTTDPKKSFKSASTIHSPPASISFQTLRKASFVDRPRRYPKLTASNIGFRGRDARYWAPPAQIHTSGFPACGSYLGWLTAKRRSGAWVTRARSCARCVLCWPTFPLVAGLGSTRSADGSPPLFAGFAATTSESDFSCPFIIGYGSSPSRYGPVWLEATRPGKRSPRFRRVPFGRDVALDPGRATEPRIAAPHVLPSASSTASASALLPFRGSSPHPTRLLCTLRRGRHLPRRNTRYRAGATPYPDRTFTGWTSPAFLAHRRSAPAPASLLSCRPDPAWSRCPAA